MHATLPLLVRTDSSPLRRGVVDTLQVNLGYRCNQSCQHCHVDAGPTRTEEMSADTIADIVSFLETLSGPFSVQQMPRLPPTPGGLID